MRSRPIARALRRLRTALVRVAAATSSRRRVSLMRRSRAARAVVPPQPSTVADPRVAAREAWRAYVRDRAPHLLLEPETFGAVAAAAPPTIPHGLPPVVVEPAPPAPQRAEIGGSPRDAVPTERQGPRERSAARGAARSGASGPRGEVRPSGMQARRLGEAGAPASGPAHSTVRREPTPHVSPASPAASRVMAAAPTPPPRTPAGAPPPEVALRGTRRPSARSKAARADAPRVPATPADPVPAPVARADLGHREPHWPVADPWPPLRPPEPETVAVASVPRDRASDWLEPTLVLADWREPRRANDAPSLDQAARMSWPSLPPDQEERTPSDGHAGWERRRRLDREQRRR
jgi:hypothetical protein